MLEYVTPFVDDAERNAPPAQFKEQTYVGDKMHEM